MTQESYTVGLIRVGDNVKKYKLIDFREKNEVTIGRSQDATFCILSTMISRCHAVFKKEGDTWSIRDNKSLNGVFINGKRLEPHKPYILDDTDKVQLGVPKDGEQTAEFIFTFHYKIKVKRARPKSADEPDCSKSTQNSRDQCPLKRMKLNSHENNMNEKPSCSKGNIYKKPLPFDDYKDKLTKQQGVADVKLNEFELKLAEMQKVLREKEEEHEEMRRRLEAEKQERENQTLQMKEKLKEKEVQLENQTSELREMLKEKEEELNSELQKREEDERKMKEDLENQLMSREAELLEQLQSQKDALVIEKQKVEGDLQKAMERAIEEKNKELEEQLHKEKERLEKVITQKETEQKMLEAQLQATKQENNQQSEAILQTRQDILTNFSDLIETELQCSICNELYIQATSLNCSHSFCALCIAEWMKVKKECPICRAPVTSQMKSIALDNYIDTMVEHLSEELKTRRKHLVTTRKEEQAKIEKAKQEAARANDRGGRQGRGRGRRRGGRGQGGRGQGERGQGGRGQGGRVQRQAPNTTENREGHRPIIIESDEETDTGNVVVGVVEEEVEMEDLSDDSSSDSDAHFYSDLSDEDAIDGEPGAYYGGYGHCYRCGHRGHWANGCPYR
ncbi:E3 ubiquitin-protein ligase RNF8-like [Ostrea edulis]|uniref:E3 ubiquitin-protein ligase RNF8-like n=1 Tax=Ostrea edulis TaxID=37623 RepID=UPI0024AF1897|nr:E3 ubiquitin-protein ligase RNF8-like [Ostrea edulis]